MFAKSCFLVHLPCIAVRACMRESSAHLMALYLAMRRNKNRSATRALKMSQERCAPFPAEFR